MLFSAGACSALTTPLKSEPDALMQRSAGAVRRASVSQITAAGRVLGSNISRRCPVSPSMIAVPARVAAVVGVVKTRTFGSFGRIRRGLTGRCPGGYLVA